MNASTASRWSAVAWAMDCIAADNCSTVSRSARSASRISRLVRRTATGGLTAILAASAWGGRQQFLRWYDLADQTVGEGLLRGDRVAGVNAISARAGLADDARK